MKKIICSLLFNLLMIIGLSPVTVSAATDAYKFNICGTELSGTLSSFDTIYLKNNSAKDGTEEGDASNYNIKIEHDNGFIVTFNGLEISTTNYMGFGSENDFKLVLVGNNSITVDQSTEYHTAIMCGCLENHVHSDSCAQANLTISGDGTLTAKALSGSDSAPGIGIYTTGNLTVDGGTIDITANNYGIYVKTYTVNGGALTANGKKQAISITEAPVFAYKVIAMGASRVFATPDYEDYNFSINNQYLYFKSYLPQEGTFEYLGNNEICFRYNGNNVFTVPMPATEGYYTYGTADATTITTTATNVASLPDAGWQWAVAKHAADANGVEYTFIMNDFHISYKSSGSGDGLNDGFLYEGKLNIELRGNNSLMSQDEGDISSNISGNANVYFVGEGSVDISGGSNGFSVGVFGDIYVTSGTLNISNCSFSFFGDLIVSGGSVTISSSRTNNMPDRITVGLGVSVKVSENQDGSNQVDYDAGSTSDYKWMQITYVPHVHSGELKNGQPATCESAGFKDYYECVSDSRCGKYFKDASCTEEITDLAAWKTGDGKIDIKDHSYNTQWSYDENNHWYDSTCSHNLTKSMGAHNGGVADCQNKAICATCGQAYGSLGTHIGSKVTGQAADCANIGWNDYYQCDDCDKYFKDASCTEEITDLAAWKIGDGKIDIKDHSYNTQWSYDENNHWYAASCGHSTTKSAGAHNGGVADCQNKAICATCGQAYGSLGTHIGSKVTGQAASYGVDGWKDYYQCGKCNKCFNDANCTNEIADLNAWKTGDGKIVALVRDQNNQNDTTDTEDTSETILEAASDTTASQSQFPKTGDNSKAGMYISMLLLTMIGIVVNRKYVARK